MGVFSNRVTLSTWYADVCGTFLPNYPCDYTAVVGLPSIRLIVSRVVTDIAFPHSADRSVSRTSFSLHCSAEEDALGRLPE